MVAPPFTRVSRPLMVTRMSMTGKNYSAFRRILGKYFQDDRHSQDYRHSGIFRRGASRDGKISGISRASGPERPPPPQRPSEQTTTAPHKTKKRINPRLPRRRAGSRRSSGVTAPNGCSCGQHTPDTGATPKKKTKTNPPRAISPEVARRRMTTPVVAPRSGLNPPPLTLSCHPLPSV